jgi:hypothetical protein
LFLCVILVPAFRSSQSVSATLLRTWKVTGTGKLMNPVPLIDLKSPRNPLLVVQGLQIGGTSVSGQCLHVTARFATVRSRGQGLRL